MRYEQIQVHNFAGCYIFCGLDMLGDDDGGVDILSEKLSSIFGKTSNYSELISQTITNIKSELIRFDFYVWRFDEKNYVFFDIEKQPDIFDLAPKLALKIAEKKILISSNEEYKNHIKLVFLEQKMKNKSDFDRKV